MISARSQHEMPSVRLDRRLATPLFRQVYQRIREAILDGTLPPRAPLPSSRSLAGQLSIARGTVELAYALLVGEGYVVGRAAAGTVVNPRLSQLSMLARGQEQGGKLSVLGDDLARTRQVHPFQMGLPAPDAFPRKLWARLLARRARSLTPIAMISQDPAGHAPLRQANAACTGGCSMVRKSRLFPGARCAGHGRRRRGSDSG